MAVVRENLGNGRLRPRDFRRELLERHYAGVAVASFQAERHGLAEDVDGEHPLGTGGGAQDSTLFGEALLERHYAGVAVSFSSATTRVSPSPPSRRSVTVSRKMSTATPA